MTNERLEKIIEQVQCNDPAAIRKQIIEVIGLCDWRDDLSYLAIADLVLDYLNDPLTDEDNEPVTIEQSIPKCTCDQPDQDCRCGSCYCCRWHDQAAYNVHRLFFGG